MYNQSTSRKYFNRQSSSKNAHTANQQSKRVSTANHREEKCSNSQPTSRKCYNSKTPSRIHVPKASQILRKQNDIKSIKFFTFYPNFGCLADNL